MTMNSLEENLKSEQEESNTTEKLSEQGKLEKNDATEKPVEQDKEEENPPEQGKREEKEEVKWFECSLCNLREVYDSKTTQPKYVQHIKFTEGSYIVKDPFTPPEKKQFFILGSDCWVCKNPVCQSNDCSVFFKQRYCQNCAWEKRNVLPEQLKSKIKNPNSY